MFQAGDRASLKGREGLQVRSLFAFAATLSVRYAVARICGGPADRDQRRPQEDLFRAEGNRQRAIRGEFL